MNLSILLLATLSQEWSKWFFIGIVIGIPLIIVAAVITYFQTRNNPDSKNSEVTSEQQKEDCNQSL